MRLLWRSRRQREDDLRAEIEAHLRMAVAERVARGESPEQAERAARREFGNVELVSEAAREAWGGMWLDRLLRDLRYGLRGLRRSPGFAAAAIVTLALGVGANTAVFTVVNGVLLRPLPFEQPEDLVLVSHMEPEPMFAGAPPSMYETTFAEVHQVTRSLEHLAAFAPARLTLTEAGDPARLLAAMVTADFMQVLRTRAAMGRTFVEGEDQPGSDPVVVIGDALWRERFGGSADVIGREILLDGASHTVIGVMPPSFDFPYDAQLWVPMRIELLPNVTWMRPVVGRLRPGSTPEEAEQEVARIASTVGAPPGHEMVTRVTPLKEFFTAGVERSMLVFAGAVALVLLIACANVANLLLIRGASRSHEIAVRSALGASRARIVRQLLTESLVLASVGGLAGVLLSLFGVRALLAIAPAGRIPRLEEVRIDGLVLAVSLAVTVAAGLLFGLAPALAAPRQRLSGAVEGGMRSLGGRHEGLRRSLAALEIAFAIVLLTGAGLLLRSFTHMRAIDPGFETERTLVVGISLPDAKYPDAEDRQAFYTNLLERLRRVPGVEQAGGVNWPPLSGQVIRGDFAIENIPRPRGWVLDKLVAMPGYFQAMGINVLYGRGFTATDRADAPGVAVISRSVARQFWPPEGAEAVGERISAEDNPKAGDWLTIVGVVDDVTQRTVTGGGGRALYMPVLQTSRPLFLGEMTFVVRTGRAAAEIAPVLRAAVSDLDPYLPISRLAAMEDVVSGTISEPRFEARLLSAFALLALLLAAVGTYGVLAHDVTSRTREIGLRMALGAKRSALVRMVLVRVLLVAAPGVVLGTLGALALARVLTHSLYEVSPSDPATLAVVSATLFGVSLLAAFMPARRATRVDPLVALRQE
jgi:predicted permease